MTWWFAIPENRENFRESRGYPLPPIEILEGSDAIEALAPIVCRLDLPERSGVHKIWEATYSRCRWEQLDLDLALVRVNATDGDMLLHTGSDDVIVRMQTRHVLRALADLRIGDMGPDLLMAADASWLLYVDYHDIGARGVGLLLRRVR